jgi:hypothetical protein
VKKNDPRGVVICPDCGTWHHKDCWDVTGSCRSPINTRYKELLRRNACRYFSNTRIT